MEFFLWKDDLQTVATTATFALRLEDLCAGTQHPPSPLGVLLMLLPGLHRLGEGQAKSIEHAQWSRHQGQVSRFLLLFIELLLPGQHTTRLRRVGVDLPKERQLSLRRACRRREGLWVF